MKKQHKCLLRNEQVMPYQLAVKKNKQKMIEAIIDEPSKSHAKQKKTATKT